MPMPQAISLLTFLVAIVSIWVHIEIRLAEINVELFNMKQDLILHKSDNPDQFNKGITFLSYV